MISLVQMRQLMHHNIFQTLLRPAGQQRIQIDAACAHVAGAPARFHTMHLKPCMTHAHFLFPCLQQLLSSAGYLLLIEEFYKGAFSFIIQLTAVIKVDSVSLHNLTNVFLTSHDFEYALNLAKLGLDRFPRSVTHLADAVQACARLGHIEEGMAFVNQALEIRMDRWDWYLVVWVASFFKYALDSLPDDECEALVSKAVDILNSYEACHAFDERVRNQKAEVLAAANHMAEAAEELEDAIFSPQRTPIDKSMTLMPASQCCMTYLQLFGSTVAARKIGDVARRGYASLAQNHQSASASAFLLYEAFALDSEISNQREYADGFGNETKVTQLLDAYEIAYRQADDDETRELIRQRFDVACSRAHLKNRTLG